MSQVLQLGLSGAETTLPTDSRSFVNFDNALISTDGRSADGTMHTDFINSKEAFTIVYAVVSEANKDIITDIFKLQITNATFLSFKYTIQSGATVTRTVKMSAPSFGAVLVKDVYYHN
ncbi:hypothetical protein KA005_13560, partial [bacterium]|nr:hypothetical protein [bacterium]